MSTPVSAGGVARRPDGGYRPDREAAFHRFAPLVPKIVNGLNLSAPGMTRDDFLQEAYINLVQAIDAYSPETCNGADLETWCRSLVRNRLIDKQRVHAALKRSLGSVSLDDPACAEVPGCDFHLRDLDLDRAIQSLTDDERRLLDMYFTEEMTDREISVAVGTTKHKVHHRRTQAVERLRSAYMSAQELAAYHAEHPRRDAHPSRNAAQLAFF